MSEYYNPRFDPVERLFHETTLELVEALLDGKATPADVAFLDRIGPLVEYTELPETSISLPVGVLPAIESLSVSTSSAVEGEQQTVRIDRAYAALRKIELALAGGLENTEDMNGSIREALQDIATHGGEGVILQLFDHSVFGSDEDVLNIAAKLLDISPAKPAFKDMMQEPGKT